MASNTDGIVRQFIDIDFPKIAMTAGSERQIKHLVEVAIINTTQPVYAEQVPTHKACDCIGIEIFHQQSLVGFTLTAEIEIMSEAVDWQIGERQKAVKSDAEIV